MRPDYLTNTAEIAPLTLLAWSAAGQDKAKCILRSPNNYQDIWKFIGLCMLAVPYFTIYYIYELA